MVARASHELTAGRGGRPWQAPTRARALRSVYIHTRNDVGSNSSCIQFCHRRSRTTIAMQAIGHHHHHHHHHQPQQRLADYRCPELSSRSSDSKPNSQSMAAVRQASMAPVGFSAFLICQLVVPCLGGLKLSRQLQFMDRNLKP